MTSSALASYRMLDFERPRFTEQDMLNQSAPSADNVRACAERQMAAYPQYANHWDGWILVRCVRDVVGKGGLRFAVGDVAIMNPNPDRSAEYGIPAGCVTVYSVRGSVDCTVDADRFEVIQ